jgi:hypothetical protein
MLTPRIPGAVVSLATLLLSVPAAAQAPDKAQCVTDYEQTQALRNQDRLRDARDKALLCAQDACPEVVKTDCARWLGEIEQSIPTVTFAVRGPDGNETSDVIVDYDGAPLKQSLDGKAAAVDPGEHTFTFKHGSSGETREAKVIIREGEKNRKIEVTFQPGAAPVDEVGPSAGTPDTGASDDGGGVPIATIILGGVGIVGLGLFATFGLLGTSEKSDLEDSCAPGCTDDEVDPVRTKFLVADISLAVGVVSLATAIVIWAASGSSDGAESAGLSVDVAPTDGGGFASVGGRF